MSEDIIDEVMYVYRIMIRRAGDEISRSVWLLKVVDEMTDLRVE